MTASDKPDPTVRLELATEDASVTKRVKRTLVRATRTTTDRLEVAQADLMQEQVVIRRVAVGRVVDAVPPVRQEGDVTIMPVVEEEMVVVRRLVLKEEVHVRRVRATIHHAETVALREQHVSVSRIPLEADDQSPDHFNDQEGMAMTDETIVAVFDTADHAEAAIASLKSAGVPADAISLHAGHDEGSTTSAAPVREEGFWASLFGGTPDHDTAVYDRSLAAGSMVVTVTTSEGHIDHVLEILESHDPVDIDERAAGYGLNHGPSATATHLIDRAAPATAPAPALAATPGRSEDHGRVQLAEEVLEVGKRVVNRGGTRIHRYVVEKPVEERVSLHEERVVLERHPVTDGRPVTDNFTDKTIEMTETAEEAVVSKTARVYEEIGLRKEVNDRVETVRDTVRRDAVEIEQVPGTATAGKVPEMATTGTALPPKL